MLKTINHSMAVFGREHPLWFAISHVVIGLCMAFLLITFVL